MGSQPRKMDKCFVINRNDVRISGIKLEEICCATALSEAIFGSF
uniref:Uncharacterized protein n=1 Tax=Rhizophora mucronata TaxID=61149 RepID=A0A2P2P4Z3_RHIMU